MRQELMRLPLTRDLGREHAHISHDAGHPEMEEVSAKMYSWFQYKKRSLRLIGKW